MYIISVVLILSGAASISRLSQCFSFFFGRFLSFVSLRSFFFLHLSHFCFMKFTDILHLYLWHWPLESQKLLFLFTPHKRIPCCEAKPIITLLKMYRLMKFHEWLNIFVFFDTEITKHSVSCPETVRFILLIPTGQEVIKPKNTV